MRERVYLGRSVDLTNRFLAMAMDMHQNRDLASTDVHSAVGLNKKAWQDGASIVGLHIRVSEDKSAIAGGLSARYPQAASNEIPDSPKRHC